MRQLITRLDDELHARLKQRARDEGRSVNAVVTDLLNAVLSGEDEHARVHRRALAAGLLVDPPRTEEAPPRDMAIEATRGAGSTASASLDSDRGR